jgi:hypothetical protein
MLFTPGYSWSTSHVVQHISTISWSEQQEKYFNYIRSEQHEKNSSYTPE